MKFRAKFASSAFYYDYTIKDHLGNARVNFRANGNSITYLEQLHYYPFGMLIEGLGTVSPTNDYAYNGKELNEDFDLNLSDYGARWYDAAVGRWWNVDPMGDFSFDESSYSYAGNNAMKNIDLLGLLKFPAGSNYESQYSELTEFLSGEGLSKLLNNPDIRNGLKVIGNYTDETINTSILNWNEGIVIKLVPAPGGVENANGYTENSDGFGSAIQINEKLAKNVQNAITIEEQQAALLAIMSTILHECIHYGRNNFKDRWPQEEGRYKRTRGAIRIDGEIAGFILGPDIGYPFENSVWRLDNVITPKYDPSQLEVFIGMVRILDSSNDENERSKVPQPKV